MEHILNHKAPWSSSKVFNNTPFVSAEKSFQTSRLFTFNENKENGMNMCLESSKTPYVSPSPSKIIERRRSYLRSSNDRKEAYAFELDSVKKALRFENQANQWENSSNSKRRSEPVAKTISQQNKPSVLKMR